MTYFCFFFTALLHHYTRRPSSWNFKNWASWSTPSPKNVRSKIVPPTRSVLWFAKGVIVLSEAVSNWIGAKEGKKRRDS
ncbi:hypothetical protein TNIN_314641 [Trichonephila inaurata madagascariensis]|uniref:Uncharacterized protein n=1 Tax=Trichonephila inaurata madagascariensis TaxID=2747483 RepID=A0A8X6IT63_9ARAC|nr:hypothetical protein TNIN_314641 [Trichonephila inaurata madagascariensis]